MPTKRFAIYTLGCKVNQYDSVRLAGFLKAAGWEEGEQAELAIINTCSVTQSAWHKNAKAIRRAKQDNPQAKIVLVGCWARLYPDQAAQPGEARIIRDKDPEKIAAQLLAISEPAAACLPTPLIKQDKARYFIKVQDGCNQFCSYCIIPYARGGLWSRPVAEIEAEVRQAAAAGYREIVLTGIHLGLYGRNAGQGNDLDLNLSGLLRRLLAADERLYFRLSSIEITEVSPELIGLMAMSNGRIRPHLHISLQSGCDRTLAAMNRPYSREQFAQVVGDLRQKLPRIAITTDIIVGFPGETEEDFAETCAFARAIGFAKIHVFSFSPHPRTPAASMPDQIPPAAVKERSARLRELSSRLELDYRNSWDGQEVNATIVKADSRPLCLVSEHYLDFSCQPDDLLVSADGLRKGGLVQARFKA